MNEIFDIDMDALDRAHMRMSLHDTNTNKIRNTQRDLELYMEQKTLLGYVKLCRIFNLDPMHSLTLHLILILMSKNPDRHAVLQSFLKILPPEEGAALFFDEAAWSQFDSNDSDHLTSISDWVTLFKYVNIIKLSREDVESLVSDPRVQVFMNAMVVGNTTQDPLNLEYVVKAMLSVTLMNIPAAKMFERVIARNNSNTRDVEIRSLRTVNTFTDNCSHMPQEVHHKTFILLLRHICVTPDLILDIARIIDTCAREHEIVTHAVKKKFSIRDHVAKALNTATVQYLHTFENWSSQQRFSVTTSINVQRMLYWMKAQVVPIPEAVFLKYFDASFVSKFSSTAIHQIDQSAIIFVIKSLRVYHNNIKSLLDFRTKCMLGLNTSVRANLTLSVVLQLYVSIWQHESIREHCWRSIIGVYNYTISSSCEAFRQQHEYEYVSVIESMVSFLMN